MSRPRLLVDCDPGHDDVLALLVAARYGELVGITTVAGNAPVEHTTRNALVVCELAGLDVPVHRGAAQPIVGAARHAAAVHGVTGLDGPVLPEPTRAVDGDDAAGFIVDTARASEGLWLVPIGPFTNAALALRRDPGLAARLAGISFMGGSAGPGNRTPVAEFNVWADPEAAAVVVGAGVQPTRMAGLNLTRRLTVDDDFAAQLRAAGTPLARFCADAIGFSLDRHQSLSGVRAAPVHDVCAVLAVTHPELLTHQRRPVGVELGGRLTRGMTVVDERPYAATPGATEPATAASTVEVGYAIDAPAARALLLDAVLAPRRR